MRSVTADFMLNDMRKKESMKLPSEMVAAWEALVWTLDGCVVNANDNSGGARAGYVLSAVF